MLRKTMIVLATAAALTGGLTVDAFAYGAVAVVTVVASVAAISVAPKLAVGLRVRILPGGTAISVAREDSIATEVSITGVLAVASVSCLAGITASMTTGAATAIPLTTVTAAICRPHTEVSQINGEHHRVSFCRTTLCLGAHEPHR